MSDRLFRAVAPWAIAVAIFAVACGSSSVRWVIEHTRGGIRWGVLVVLAATAVAAARPRAVPRAPALFAALCVLSTAWSVDPRLTFERAGTLVVAFVAAAAAQPYVDRTTLRHERRDAQAMFVLDISRSMAAARGAHRATRLDRAVAIAKQMRAAVPGVRAGIATFTDRVVPTLLPIADAATFDATLDQAIAIERPTPFEVQKRSTAFSALVEIPGGNYFAPSVRHRVAVLLTDGETRPFDTNELERAFTGPPRTHLVVIRLWHLHENVFTRHGHPEAGYSTDPSSADLLDSLAAAVHGQIFSGGALAAAAHAIRASLGRGPTREVQGPARTHPLAPFVAALALLPLALVFVSAGALPRRRTAAAAADAQPSATWSTWARRVRAASANPSRS
jgi:hypothetical protein